MRGLCWRDCEQLRADTRFGRTFVSSLREIASLELTSDFNALASSIEPKRAHVAAAKGAQEKVRDQLCTDPDSKEAVKDTFLSGSYARSTAINDINDVDVIC